MKILITGAGGFIGQFLARELLKDPSHQLVLTDVVGFGIPKGSLNPRNAKIVKTDLSQDQSVITSDLDAVYVFHGIMSSGSEANFDLGRKVNLFTTQTLLETIRQVAPGIRVIYASTAAVYGRPFPEIITEDVVPTPEVSYGAQKLMIETLINDMTRKGFIDGFSLRFPTISVRPGLPTAAATSFVSGIIREPLAGKECDIPITDRSFPSWVCSPKTLIANLVHTLTLRSDALPSHKRVLNAPGIRVTTQDMLDALAKVGGEDKLQHIKEYDDPELRKILYSFPANYDNRLALGLGFRPDSSFESAVRDYVEFLEFEKNSF